MSNADVKMECTAALNSRCCDISAPAEWDRIGERKEGNIGKGGAQRTFERAKLKARARNNNSDNK
jgi:hypothetical protein